MHCFLKGCYIVFRVYLTRHLFMLQSKVNYHRCLVKLQDIFKICVRQYHSQSRKNPVYVCCNNMFLIDVAKELNVDCFCSADDFKGSFRIQYPGVIGKWQDKSQACAHGTYLQHYTSSHYKKYYIRFSSLHGYGHGHDYAVVNFFTYSFT